jgi:spore germination protein YaaH
MTLAIALALTLTALVVLPTAAVDPTPAPDAFDPATPPPPTVHAEMLAEHEEVDLAFVPGDRPQPLASRPALGGVSTQAPSGGGTLPNALEAEVFGYLPYWMLDAGSLSHLNYDLVSTIAYFGVPAQSNGTLQKSGTYWNGWTSTHMTNVINQAHAEGVKVVLTVTMMAWNSTGVSNMSTLLNSPANRQKLAADIAATVAARNADGVNLDFEPMPNALQTAYSAFVREVRSALGSGPDFTVAVTGGAASWDEGYDLAALTASNAADAIMVMGYDYSWSGSARAGGVSPIDSPYILDVGTAMADFVEALPPAKLIWGVPYYGRAWTTSTADLNSRTCANTGGCESGSWSFRYVNALDSIATHGRRWDPTGQVPWYRHDSTTYGTWVQGYYDDAQSLDVKYDRIRDAGMRGVGIWHLLMDAGRWELWDELAQNFSALPYNDIDDSPFWQEIVWLSETGITTGCGNGRFCPTATVRRGEMASFLVRALDLEPATGDHFTDDGSSIHEDSINRLAEAGITVGCGPGRFCPNGTVRRDEMASFLARALDLPDPVTDHFTDDGGNVHQSNINRLADAGIASGCTTTRYCPSGVVSREQMAAFLQRALTPLSPRPRSLHRVIVRHGIGRYGDRRIHLRDPVRSTSCPLPDP